MESELMEAGGTIDEASSHCWSGICLWGNRPQERPVFLPHTVQGSESSVNTLDDRGAGACTHTHAQVHVREHTHMQGDTGQGKHAEEVARWLMMLC